MKRFLCLGLTALLAACDNAPLNPPITGYVEAEWVHITAPSAGWIETLAIKEGDQITVGDPLFVLDDDQAEAQLAAARARLREADARARDLETGARDAVIHVLRQQRDEAEAARILAAQEDTRWAQLVAEGTAPQARRDRTRADLASATARVAVLDAQIAEAQLAARPETQAAAYGARENAEAAVQEAEWRLQERRITARVSGRVQEIYARAGEYATTGQPVLALLPQDALKLRFFVNHARLNDIQVGMPLDVEIDGAPSRSARISYIARDAEFTPPVIYAKESRDALVFAVEARFEGAVDLKAGQPVDVRLP